MEILKSQGKMESYMELNKANGNTKKSRQMESYMELNKANGVVYGT